MFDEAYRTLFISSPSKLFHRDNNLCITQNIDVITIPLKDIHTIIIDTPQVSLNSSLLDAFAQHKILLFVSDRSHMPSGVFTSFLSHYKSYQVLQYQVSLSKQDKAVLWQKIVQSKICNQANLLFQEGHEHIASKLWILQEKVELEDASNNEAKAAKLYFPCLFGKGFMRKKPFPINLGLNYGYSILRGVIARNIIGSGLLPSLGIFHANQFNPFNLADDLIEPYRPFVDSKIVSLKLKDPLSIKDRFDIANILNTKVSINGKFYPMYRAITKTICSVANIICKKQKTIHLPLFNKDSNGREIYESHGDV